MTTPEPGDFLLLFQVFRAGLKLGLISKDEVVAWADNIITTTDEPDYFFIELSLSHNTNALMEVLNKYPARDKNPVCDRVIFSLIYHRKPIHDVTEVESIATLAGGLYAWDHLTGFENITIFNLEDYWNDLPQLQAELINFLGIYKEFTLDNFNEWAGINEHVLEVLKDELVRVNAVNATVREAWAKKEKKRKLKRTLRQIFIIVLFLAFFIGLVLLGNNNTFPIPYGFVLLYFIARIGYGMWKKSKKR